MFIRMYGASAQHILDGEYFRTATALMLHADSLHLAGNLLGIALFGTAVCSVTGWGVGWLIILVSGISGNLINAVIYRFGHISIGASTAVFGAIGFLAAYQFLKRFNLPGGRIKAWLPLGGGLALLGILGTGQYVDVLAHLFGFGSGILLGLTYGLFIKRPASVLWQVVCFMMAAGALLVSWMAAVGNG